MVFCTFLQTSILVDQAVLIATRQASLDTKLESIVRIASYAPYALEPMNMRLGPISATKKALKLADWNIQQVELAEINEALAGQSTIVIKELGIDECIVNANGGGIALCTLTGSVCRIVVSLIHEMYRRQTKKAIQ
ncbi:hypothetical protein [Marinomonas mediterranea]|uniref:hypothetical protein n=1 Tax=Marinomonas mediterranea TaxID=119864 RepID=UPI002349B554|nr:hypothetical protein [Marinomonas mediterranea]WCN08997.1 hypothetical protein GV055_08715 [Marinomonas mediterranea]